MPRRAQRRPATPPSEGSSDEVDGNFVTDPDQIFDILPQPFRLIDKTLNQIFDRAWEIIENIEEDKALRRSKACLPTFDCGNSLLDYSEPSCVCSMSDGGYIFVACSFGLAVLDPFLGVSIATFEDAQGKNVVQMSSCCLQDGVYIICTLDDVGKLHPSVTPHPHPTSPSPTPHSTLPQQSTKNNLLVCHPPWKLNDPCPPLPHPTPPHPRHVAGTFTQCMCESQ